MAHSASPPKATKKRISKLTVRQQWLLDVVRSFGRSKRDFARAIDINYTTIVSMTRGTREVSDRTVYRIMMKLSVPPPQGMRELSKGVANKIGESQAEMIIRLAERVRLLEKHLARYENGTKKKS